MKTSNLDKFLMLFFPKRCACCGKVIYPNMVLCGECDVESCRVPYPKCNKCGQQESMCKCSAESYMFDRFIAPFYYEGPIRECIMKYKYSGFVDNGRFLALEMVKAFEEEYVFDKPDLIVSVPMRKRRKRRRGFSQTDMLAKYISEETEIEFKKNLLIKVKDTPPQVGLDAIQRRSNLIGAFEVAKGVDLKGRTVIVCDDNKTTGSTLSECSKALKKAGAKTVVALTAAITKNGFRGETD